MKKLNFICTFKSDIVLHASSNTEGNIDILDYIPGSNFLGMVASKYGDFGADAFDIFHSGKVRFGDAHIVHNGQMTYQVPYAWYAKKGSKLEDSISDNALYCEHYLTTDDYETFKEKDIQLKQQRMGFITAEGKIAKIKHNYTQKSAYDKSARRSKKGQMFGYYALAKETQWAFTVEVDDDIDDSVIIEILKKSTGLGKSRSAQYGRISIQEDQNRDLLSQNLSPIKIDEKYYLFLYAKSRLALTDKYGSNNYMPTLASLGFSDEGGLKIDWEKSQIRTSRYTPYIGARRNFDPERLIVNKGSVIAVEVPQDFSVENYAKNIAKGIGLYLSEGHGKVLVNPSFLTAKQPVFTGLEKSAAPSTPIGAKSSGVLDIWLQEEKQKEEQQFELLNAVKIFIETHRPHIRNKKSQWGQVRSLCLQAANSDTVYDLLFSEEEVNGHAKGFLMHGKAKEKWSNTLIDALKDVKKTYADDSAYLQFVKLVSIYAPKEDEKEGELS